MDGVTRLVILLFLVRFWFRRKATGRLTSAKVDTSNASDINKKLLSGFLGRKDDCLFLKFSCKSQR